MPDSSFSALIHEIGLRSVMLAILRHASAPDVLRALADALDQRSGEIVDGLSAAGAREATICQRMAHVIRQNSRH